MSLIAWYPLNGDTKDYSGNNYVVASSNLVVDNSGKIGKCYAFNGNSNQKIYRTWFGQISQKFTVCGWIYQTNNTDQQFYISQGRDSGTNYGINIAYNNNKIRIFVGTTLKEYPYTLLNKWTHIAVTGDSKNIYVYIDGSLIEKFAQTTINFNEASGAFAIGKMAFGYSSDTTYFPAKARINDVRVYDHPASSKEIKAISQAKIAHYDFNTSATGLTNLSKNPTYQPYNNYHPNAEAKVERTWRHYNGCEIYRLTMKVVADNNVLANFRTSLGGHGIYMCNQLYKMNTQYCYKILWRPVTHPDTRCGGTASNMGGWIERPSKYYKDGWNIVGQYRNGTVTTERSDNIFTSVCAQSLNLNEDFIVEFCCPSLYETIEDFDFTSYNNYNKVTDCSGYANHGIIEPGKRISWLQNSGTETGHYRFIGNAGGIKMPPALLPNGCKIEELTISAKVFRDDVAYGATSPNIVALYDNYFFRFRVDAGSKNIWFLASNGGSFEHMSIPNTIIPANKWTNVTVTYNRGTVIVYFDGIEKGRATTTKTYLENTTTVHGKYIGSYDSASETWIGKIDNVQIFAKALTAAEIKEKASIKASIDDKGNMHIGEIIEKVNYAFVINRAIKNKTFSNGLSAYTQTNCGVAITDEGIAIYRPPNLVYPACGNTVWGGAIISLPEGTFKKGRKYRVNYSLRGKTSNKPECTLSHSTGWPQVGGLTYLTSTGPNAMPANYENWSEAKVFSYDFDLTNFNTYQKTTIGEGGLVAGQYYNCCNQLKFGFNYESTGPLGSSIEIKHVEIIDITDGLTAKVTKSGQLITREINEVNGMKIRYIRDWLGGSNANAFSHFVEVQALDKHGRNWALNQPVTANFTPSGAGALPLVTDGDTATGQYVDCNTSDGTARYVQIDLGANAPDICAIRAWHYYADARKYNNIISVSSDGTNWINVFDSYYDGTYTETSSGKTHYLAGNNKFSIHKDGGCSSTQFIEGGI